MNYLKIAAFKRRNFFVEEYYQELQTGMIRCGIVADNEAMLARFMGGLNKEIQTILEYKEYTNITHLFHLACKADPALHIQLFKQDGINE